MVSSCRAALWLLLLVSGGSPPCIGVRVKKLDLRHQLASRSRAAGKVKSANPVRKVALASAGSDLRRQGGHSSPLGHRPGLSSGGEVATGEAAAGEALTQAEANARAKAKSRVVMLRLGKMLAKDSQKASMDPPGVTMADRMLAETALGSEAVVHPQPPQTLRTLEAPSGAVARWNDDRADMGWPTGDGSFTGPTWDSDVDTGNTTLRELLMDIGGGTGASIGGTGSAQVDRALLRRMRHQDKMVVLLFVLVYFGSLIFCLSVSYQQAQNTSHVAYYADPRFDTFTLDGDSCDSNAFLEAFNQPPKDAQLQVTGLVPMRILPTYVVDTAVTWLGARYRVAFSFALDLSPWLVRDGGDASHEAGHRGAAESVSAKSEERLQQFLAADAPDTFFRNDLAYVELHKHVEWKEWEELATNIKSQIRQSGFRGVINVHRNGKEILGVHKNRSWANFMHSRQTKVVLALTIVGWLLYQPYMWLRHRATAIHCRYRVDVSIGAYWPLIADKIGADGFNCHPVATTGGVAAGIGQLSRSST